MNKFKPFSDNIIFFDTEFTDFDINRGELMSIGMVKVNDEELYLELDYQDKPCDWVEKHVLPNLTGEKMDRKEAAKKIKKFIGKDKPYAVAYVNQFDMAYLNKLIPHEETPFNWLPIDFASVLFALGIDPASMTDSNKKLLEDLQVDSKQYKKHNALDDARLLKEAYLKLKNQI